jgi:hypothetical protein
LNDYGSSSKKRGFTLYYESYDWFVEAIQGGLLKVGEEAYEPKLKTLLYLKFQTFKKS